MILVLSVSAALVARRALIRAKSEAESTLAVAATSSEVTWARPWTAGMTMTGRFFLPLTEAIADLREVEMEDLRVGVAA